MEVRVERIARRVALGDDTHILVVGGVFARPEPGQFCMLSLVDRWPCLLPRPFSYFDVAPDHATFLVKAVGPGTRALVEAEPGSELRVSGPFGRAFPTPVAGTPVCVAGTPVCVAGGVGLAPFLLVAKRCAEAGSGRLPIVYGAPAASGLVGREAFDPDTVAWQLATDDGSAGRRGTAFDLYRALVEAGEVDGRAPVHCCGPWPLMRSVARFCAERGTACHVSLETFMACGFGVCNGCTVDVREGGRYSQRGYARCCVDGPVFAAEELDW